MVGVALPDRGQLVHPPPVGRRDEVQKLELYRRLSAGGGASSFEKTALMAVRFVPFLGDVFDAAWKANARNLVLLDAHFRDPRRTKKSSRLFVAGLIAALVAFIALTATVAIVLVRLLVQAFS